MRGPVRVSRVLIELEADDETVLARAARWLVKAALRRFGVRCRSLQPHEGVRLREVAS